MNIGYVKISNWSWWKFMWRCGSYAGLFRNQVGILPGRWGFYILGLEVGSRNPQDRVGVWLHRHGLWRW